MPARSHFACRPLRPAFLTALLAARYRLRLEREGNRVRLISRGGTDWSDRFPLIVETARKTRHRQFVIDGEAVCSPSPAYPISTACAHVGTTSKCSSTPSMCWQWTVTI